MLEINSIIAVNRGQNGQMLDFKLDNGEVLNFEECAARVQAGRIYDVDYVNSRYGMVIKSIKDDDKTNNLQDLPSF